MKNEKLYIRPEFCLYNSDDDTQLVMEIHLPGVKKKDIDLHMNDDSFTLKAPRGDIEYRISDVLCCAVNSKESKAEYNDGLLIIKTPYKDRYENAVKIKVA